VSVYDFEGAVFAKDMELAGLKIASSNITHQPLIEFIADLGLPIILDTGHSTLEEISRAVNWLQDAGAENIVIEHSPLAPPSGVELHNLRFMNTLGAAFDLPYGLSDHHNGVEMLFAGAALGASILEKGVRPNNLGDEQDAAHALSLDNVAEVHRGISNIAAAMGNGVRNLSRNREKYRSRMGLVAKRNLTTGDYISLDTVTFAFPARGIPVEHWSELCGAILIRPLNAGEVIRWEDVSYPAG